MIELGHKNVIDIVKYRWVWLCLSVILIFPGIFAMIYSSVNSENHMPLKVGIDFTGGTITQYTTAQKVETSQIGEIRANLEKAGVTNPQIQIINATTDIVSTNKDNKVQKADETKVDTADKKSADAVDSTTEKTVASSDKSITSIISIRTKFIDEENSETFNKITDAVKITVPDAVVEQVSSVGPTLGSELFRNSMIAMVFVFIAIIAYISWRFQFDYAVIAVISLFHDVLFIVGVFSILGLVFGTEIDSLFITALLTVVGFSNHDTIVVFDRIRENIRFYSKKATISEIINGSVNQTLARSINTSVTTLLTLAALYIFGGVTTRDFVLAMILGILIGTYTSIFFASTLLDWYKESKQKGKTVARAE